MLTRKSERIMLSGDIATLRPSHCRTMKGNEPVIDDLETVQLHMQAYNAELELDVAEHQYYFYTVVARHKS